jgi:hypothetical protein
VVTSASGWLSGHAYFVHWGVIQISLPNLLVIAAMLVLFLLALVLPFPHGQDTADAPTADPQTVDDHR